jgi:glycosyltransferase involved in cell wall biosynthesis
MESPLKLAILGTRGIPAQYGGFETFAEEIAVRLTSRGVDVTVFCPSRTAKPDDRYRGVTLRYVKYPPESGFSEVLWDCKCFWAARHGFDVVYMLGVGASFAAWIPRLSGTKVWINSDGLEWKRTKWNPAQRLYLALAETLGVILASRIIADSPAIDDYLRSRYMGYKQISTIAYGAEVPIVRPDHGVLAEWGLAPYRYSLVVCRLEPENHVLEIVEGFEMASTSYPLVVLGDVRTPNRYVRRLLTHASDHVRFIGTVYDKRKLEALRYYSWAYFHGHSVGGTNPSLLEAMACSNLVVAHDNAFNRSVLDDAGLYFSDSDDLASLLIDLEASGRDTTALRAGANAIIEGRFQWGQIADEYLQLLREEKRTRSGISRKPSVEPLD